MIEQQSGSAAGQMQLPAATDWLATATAAAVLFRATPALQAALQLLQLHRGMTQPLVCPSACPRALQTQPTVVKPAILLRSLLD